MGLASGPAGMRVLLVEDEPSAAQLIAKGLREHTYAVDIARDGLVASHHLGQAEYDIVVLDVMLPRKDGLHICQELRARGSTVPVLMLTARDSVEARIAGLDSGADDYLTKPFNFGELLARMRSLARRRHMPMLAERLALGALCLDTRTHELTVDGLAVALTAREYALLEYFWRRHGDVVSRAELAEHVWDDRFDPLSNVIDVYVQRLRRKIDRPGAPSLIRARRGEGYQFVVGSHPS